MAIGQDLLNVPFPDMVYNLARAIADGQKRLDKNSLNTLKELARTKFDFIESITEVLLPVPQTINVGGNEITVTGINVETTISPPTNLTLLQAGLTPTCHSFPHTQLRPQLHPNPTINHEV